MTVTNAIIYDYSHKIMTKPEMNLVESYKEALQQGKQHREVFDWPSALEVLDKVIEEAHELKEAIESQTDTEVFTEASDLIFTVVQTLRHLQLDLGDCLNYSNKKFMTRFKAMTDIANEKNLELKTLGLQDLEDIWAEAKVLSQNKVNKLAGEFLRK